MKILGVILARAGSKGLPRKCMRDLLGRPLIAYTFDHARTSALLTDIVLTTDCREAAELAHRFGIDIVKRPAELATDTATVDTAVRHAVLNQETRDCASYDFVVILYGNIPVRADGIIDRTVKHLIDAGADSVRTVSPVTKLHPDWLHRLEGDRMTPYRPNSIHRRQDLEPLFYHDGSVIAVTRTSLFAAENQPDDAHAFFGRDRRALIQQPHETVDVDEQVDLFFAEAILNARPKEMQEQDATR